ncbi:amino acid permease [Thermobispora bispora]|jgi:amino acid transporter|uniref:Amino acid permease-associated region n=1 Tax=Thermobispora bispora (strain ATCC 19993 / DSM 43833 / CBS 139.67 / JCM 10125 / KCTC 9307 / NBRC 14880 / R51) TaxID=469371 RepID=D6Y6B9_THEBD|nr:APC family permease [Thermobispora bispora]MBO2472832.1 APC family permease [Actinomycetales bacterium]MDI9581665.1 APC family permease [Thermobispora sp.]ADG87491.1 amino acid permease-associated region [Thermobispora bispora DSM 43833]MBX6167434.1 APC family permease [Thermobispora bispora]QSI47427.1 APC family permease [Thermobispora bispora]
MSLTEQRQSVVTAALAKDALGVPSVVFFVISAAAPLMVSAGVVTTAYAATGVLAVPLAFIVLGAVLGIFSVGYVTMARYTVNAGAFYAYTSQGIGKPVGVATAWIALIAYSVLQVGLYGVIGPALEPLLTEWFGVAPPWWAIALVGWALTAILGLMRVDVNGRVLAVLLVAEITIVVVYGIANLFAPAPTGLNLDVFNPANFFVPGVGALIALCGAAFSGFEASVVFSEESKDPKRTVPMATYVALGIMTALYTLSAWLMTVPVGKDKIIDAARDQSTELLFGLAGQNIGSFAATIGSVLFVTSIFAAMIAFHNTLARYVFALGRENVLPAFFGRTSPTGSPAAGSLAQSASGLAVIVIYAVFGLDPLTQLFFVAGAFGGLGILLLLLGTSIAVLFFFAKRTDLNETAWRTRIAPAIATVLLLTVLAVAMANFDVVLGVSPDSPLRWVLPGVYVAAAVLGVVWGLVLRARRPEVYVNIGLGPEADLRRRP